MKRKLLLAALCVVGALGFKANAQTDVTSTYLTNADFSQSTALTDTYLYGYSKDGSPANFQTVTGWTHQVTKTNGSGTGAGGYAGGVFSYGSSTHLKGNDKGAPSAGPNGESGNCFGFFAVWGAGGYYYQNVTFPAGAYIIKVPMYNQSGTQANTSYTGFFPTNGTNQTVAVNPTVGQWVEQSVSFTLDAETAGQIRIGYESTGSGSGANPMLFIDKVQILSSPFATADDYTALNTAISTVESKTLGFDAGEYAPYNNVEVLKALAEAKAVDQNKNNPQVTIQNLTTVLNNVKGNETEVNAIWDASFEHEYSTSGNVQPLAWTGPSGHDNATDVRWMWNVNSNAGLAATSSSKALFTKFGAYYGKTDGYTMPLNANTYYTISFVYGGWSDCKKNGYVTITDPENTSISLFPSKDLPLDAVDGNSNKDSWKNYQAFFKTSAEGNYVLGLLHSGGNTQSQYVYGDFELKTTTEEDALFYYGTVLDEVDDSYDAEANGGTEKTAFKAAIDANMNGKTVNEIMEAAANLYTLRDAFVAATPYYDRYLAEKANAERIDASLTSDVTEPTTAEEAKTALQTILVNEYNYVKENFNADAAATYGITIDKWTGTATSGGNADTPQTNSNEKWGESATTYYEQGQNGWSSNAWTLNYTKTVTLPANTYVLKVAARASTGTTATLKATIGETTYTEALPNFGSSGLGITTNGVASFDSNDDFSNNDNGYGWQWRYLIFTLDEEGEVTLQIDASANAAHEWCSFGDVAVVSNVTTDALEAAYNNFEMKTLGFEEGQYAPYNNVELLTAYNQAKAIVEGEAVPSTQPEVDALTSTLTAAEWSAANATDVDAIFNGRFSSNVEGDWGLTGWTRTNAWGQQRTNVGGDYATAYYNQPGSLKYGDTGVYTMPLAANTWYKLTFAYRSHENNSNNGVTVSVLNGGEGLANAAFDGNGSTTKWKVAEKYFSTGAAGNYVLTLANNGNTWMTGVSLVKETPANIVKTSSANLQGYKTFYNADLNYKADENTEVYIAAAPNKGYVSLTKMADRIIPAGTPVILKTANQYDITLTPTAAPSSNKFDDNVLKVAETTGTIEGAYILAYTTANGLGFYQFTGSLNAGDVYLTAPAGANVRLGIIADGEATGIAGVDAEAGKDTEVIYNMAGQRVDGSYKGIVIKNGKKILVK